MDNELRQAVDMLLFTLWTVRVSLTAVISY